MTQPLPTLLSEIKKRCDSATAGPWLFEEGKYPTNAGTSNALGSHSAVYSPADAEFIAHAREDVENLLEALTVCMEQRDSWMGEHEGGEQHHWQETDNEQLRKILAGEKSFNFHKFTGVQDQNKCLKCGLEITSQYSECKK